MITIETNLASIPVLKPLALKQEFIDKIKGKSLSSNKIMIIADQDEYVFFLMCKEEWNEYDIANADLAQISQQKGMMSDGTSKSITLARAVDMSKIFKMNYHELKSKIDYEHFDPDLQPYLGIEDQLKVVNELSIRLRNVNDLPRLIVLRKNK
ncbi:hypothetical protein [Mycoplasma simbae]|uniref:hypothetical protein n=1 Tax=Mycoplasma simbae TaxID=36744 RepID=UPI00055D7666|nr:hypothetical protein [Mycoplasma simbae]